MKDGWKAVPFGEAVTDESGGNAKIPQGNLLPVGLYPVVDQGQSLVAGYTDDERALCRTRLPTIVFGDHTRVLKFVDFPFCMGADGTKVLRPSSRIDAKYLYHFLRHIDVPSAGYSRHFKYLKRTSVLVPPIVEQRRIADILDKAEELRAKRRAAIAQLDTLAQSIFLEMFGDEERTIRGWNACQLGSVTSVITKGTTPTSVGLEFTDAGVPFIRVQNMKSGIADWQNDVLFVGEQTHRAFSRSQIRGGDVLVSIAGTIGRIAIVPRAAPEMNCNQAVAIVRPKGEILSEFLVPWLQSEHAQRQMNGAKVTGTISNLSLTQLRELTLPVPPIQKQQEFANRVNAVEMIRAAHHASISRLDTLFASLQHRAFRGEL